MKIAHRQKVSVRLGQFIWLTFRRLVIKFQLICMSASSNDVILKDGGTRKSAIYGQVPDRNAETLNDHGTALING